MPSTTLELVSFPFFFSTVGFFIRAFLKRRFFQGVTLDELARETQYIIMFCLPAYSQASQKAFAIASLAIVLDFFEHGYADPHKEPAGEHTRIPLKTSYDDAWVFSSGVKIGESGL